VTTTDFFEAAGFKPGTHFYGTVPAIKAEDVANAVSYLLTTPYYVNITELTLKHVSQKF
jgi:NADP-dependent 3-hydroxy acid dehydrogenase YdfG